MTNPRCICPDNPGDTVYGYPRAARGCEVHRLRYEAQRDQAPPFADWALALVSVLMIACAVGIALLPFIL